MNKELLMAVCKRLGMNIDTAEYSKGKITFDKCVVRFDEDLLPDEGFGKYFSFLMDRIAELIVNGELVDDEIHFKVSDAPCTEDAIDEYNKFIAQIHIKQTGRGISICSVPVYRIKRDGEDITVCIDPNMDWGQITKK